jgi:hypothetical protein
MFLPEYRSPSSASPTTLRFSLQSISHLPSLSCRPDRAQICEMVGSVPSTVFTGDADLLRAFRHFCGDVIDVEGDVVSRKRISNCKP